MKPPRTLLRRVEALEAWTEAQVPSSWWHRLPFRIALWGQFAGLLVEWLTESEVSEWDAIEAEVESGRATKEEAHDQVTRIFAKAEARRAATDDPCGFSTFFRELARALPGQGA